MVTPQKIQVVGLVVRLILLVLLFLFLFKFSLDIKCFYTHGHTLKNIGCVISCKINIINIFLILFLY
eukprot:SAG11_NODE_710_length_7643_cov_26.058177_7_plen_67_part_00